MKIFSLILTFFLILPNIIFAAGYGSGLYGSGLYGFQPEETEESSGSSGGGGGGGSPFTVTETIVTIDEEELAPDTEEFSIIIRNLQIFRDGSIRFDLDVTSTDTTQVKLGTSIRQESLTFFDLERNVNLVDGKATLSYVVPPLRPGKYNLHVSLERNGEVLSEATREITIENRQRPISVRDVLDIFPRQFVLIFFILLGSLGILYLLFTRAKNKNKFL